MKLFVVIVNYNLPQDTLDCIKSIRGSSFYPLNIILVDNGSEDDSIEIIKKAHLDITLITLQQNQGFVGGYNAGINEALLRDASHVFILNNDTVIDTISIEQMLQTDWDITVPKILFYTRSDIIQSAGARWRVFPPSVTLRGLGHKDGPNFDTPIQLQYASGCAMMIKRSVLENVGLFDIDYQNYMEDYDMCYRVTRAGYKIGYVPSARIYHKDSLTAGKNPKLRRWFIGRNTVLFYRKNNRFPAWYLWSFMVWLSLREIVKGNLKHLPDYWQGFKDGFRSLAR